MSLEKESSHVTPNLKRKINLNQNPQTLMSIVLHLLGIMHTESLMKEIINVILKTKMFSQLVYTQHRWFCLKQNLKFLKSKRILFYFFIENVPIIVFFFFFPEVTKL